MTEVVRVETLGFEQALTELEKVVSILEKNPPVLEETLQLYEHGRALSTHLSNLLEKAELRVRQISGDENPS